MDLKSHIQNINNSYKIEIDCVINVINQKLLLLSTTSKCFVMTDFLGDISDEDNFIVHETYFDCNITHISEQNKPTIEFTDPNHITITLMNNPIEQEKSKIYPSFENIGIYEFKIQNTPNIMSSCMDLFKYLREYVDNNPEYVEMANNLYQETFENIKTIVDTLDDDDIDNKLEPMAPVITNMFTSFVDFAEDYNKVSKSKESRNNNPERSSLRDLNI